MNCPTCKTAMKPLFTGEFCPNECDLPPEKRSKKKDEALGSWKMDTSVLDGLRKFLPATAPGVYPMNPKKPVCPNCGRSNYYQPNPAVFGAKYGCWDCGKLWS